MTAGDRITTAGPVRVLLVDDHPMWLQTLQAVIDRLEVGEVVAECADGAAAVEVATSAEVDVVVMDVDMPRLDGISAMEQMLAGDPFLRILILSAHEDRSTIAAAVRAGASGYLAKTAGPTQVAQAISRLRDGELVFPDTAAAVVRDALRGTPDAAADRTLTLLLTDIEGSTAHAAHLGDRWPQQLVAHRRLLRAAYAEFGGQDHGGRGDECVASFPSARDAVRAAVAGQRTLAAADWSRLERPIRVRVGIHTGEPVATAEGYEGIDFHRAARIRDVGTGGTILLSAVTAGLIRGSAIDGADLVDVGDVCLPGLAAPERLTRVDVHGLASGSLRDSDRPAAHQGKTEAPASPPRWRVPHES